MIKLHMPGENTTLEETLLFLLANASAASAISCYAAGSSKGWEYFKNNAYYYAAQRRAV